MFLISELKAGNVKKNAKMLGESFLKYDPSITECKIKRNFVSLIKCKCTHND